MSEIGTVVGVLVGVLVAIDIFARMATQPEQKQISINIVLAWGPFAALLLAAVFTLFFSSYFVASAFLAIGFILNVASWINLPGSPQRLDTAMFVTTSSLTAVVLVLSLSMAIVSHALGVVEEGAKKNLKPPVPTPREASQVSEELPKQTDADSKPDEASSEPRPSTIVQDEAAPDDRPHENQAGPQQNGPASRLCLVSGFAGNVGSSRA